MTIANTAKIKTIPTGIGLPIVSVGIMSDHVLGFEQLLFQRFKFGHAYKYMTRRVTYE